jgi:hypothetical protein
MVVLIDHVDTLDELNLAGLSYGEIAAALDAFYANSSNVRVPILFAFKWVKLRNEHERDMEPHTYVLRGRRTENQSSHYPTSGSCG